jgi:hypothetical protein
MLPNPGLVLVRDENLGEGKMFLDPFSHIYPATDSQLYNLRRARIVFPDILD